MAATREQIYAALQAADKAGNVEDAKALAQQYANTPETPKAAPPSAPQPKPTFMGTLARAAQNLPGDAMDTLKGIDAIPRSAVHMAAQAITRPNELVSAARPVMDQAADILGGGVQHLRDLPNGQQRGTAPRMDEAAFDTFAKGVHDKYLTKEGIYKEIGDHPVGTLITAGSVAFPALKAAKVGDALAAGADLAGGALRKVGGPAANKVADIATAGRRANSAAESMRGLTRAGLSADDAAAQADAATAAAQARASRLSARRATAKGATLEARSTAAQAASTPPDLNVGDPLHLSDIGDTLREPAVAQQGAIEGAMKAADDKYRAAMDAVAKDRADAGVGVDNTLAAQHVIAKSKALVEPNPVTRSPVGKALADTAGGKLHQQAVEVLSPKEEALTPNQAFDAIQQGVDVKTAKDGSYYRIVKPSLEDVDNFRRYLGKVLSGQVEGYEAINRIQARDLYKGVSEAMDEYVSGASTPVQQNWAAGKAALQPYENVKAGRVLTGTQPGTEVAAVPSARIPGRMLAGGRDTLKQTAAVSGQAPVSAAVRSVAQNSLAGAKTADAAEALIRPGTTLGEAVSHEPDLAAAVSDYIQRMRNAETAGTQAKDFASRADAVNSRAEKYSKIADTLSGNAAKAADAAKASQRDLAALEIMDPRKVGSEYAAMLGRAHKAGAISTAQYSDGLKLAQSAEKDFALKARRDSWLKRAAGVLGVGALAKEGYALVGH